MRYDMGVFLLIGFKNKQTNQQKQNKTKTKTKTKQNKKQKHVLQHNFALN